MAHRYRLFCLGSVLALPAAACRPVLTIGWGEIGILLLLLVLLLGPALLRVYRKIDAFRRWQNKTDSD